MSLPAQIDRLWLTIITTSYLKPTQVIYRVRMLIHTRIMHRSARYLSRFVRATNDEGSFTPLRFSIIRPVPHKLSDITIGRFSFLNRSCELGVPTDWVPANETRLWIYNLHYFDYLRTILVEHKKHPSYSLYLLFRRLINEWIDGCPIASSQAWDAYPLSLRINNWLRAYDVFEAELDADPLFASKLRQSLYTQAAFLEKNLELHLLNNHLLENGRALWYAGLFFDDADALRWRRIGHRILISGLEEHFLSDGGHDELSPMYHQIMLDMYQEVAEVMASRDVTIPEILNQRLQGMRSWLTAILHPDGELPLFNDSALGIAGDPADFTGPDFSSTDGLTALTDSGYFVLRDLSKNNFLIFDCGPMGPDHRNQHGHCDALSFELSIAGQRMIVDTGVNDYYGDIDSRQYVRSTRAHNTVVVDDEEQSEIWDRFRIARRARPKDVIYSADEQLMYVSAAHTGYERLPGKVTHRRWVCYVDQQFWVICDRLEGSGAHTVENLLHFHPEVIVEQAALSTEFGHSGKLGRGDVKLQVLAWGHGQSTQYRGQLSPLQGWYSEKFNATTENTVWGLKHKLALPAWSGYVLWPDSSNASLEFSDMADSATLTVQTPFARYQLAFNPAGVELGIVS